MCRSLKLSDRAKGILAQRSDETVWQDWQWQLAHTLTAADLNVPDVASFPMRVTPYYAALADFASPDDPILRQFMPSSEELLPDTYSPDPFGESAHAARAQGIKQRYADRVLAMMNVTCSTYCRHCTRRGLLESARCARLETLVEVVKSTPGVREVLLSGGDPLLLPDAEILRWVETLAAAGCRAPVYAHAGRLADALDRNVGKSPGAFGTRLGADTVQSPERINR